MTEYFTPAIVLDKDELGEADTRVFLYTRELGKVVAKATSARKITSKLAAHLEPLNLISARLISGKDWQIVDALRIGRLDNPEFLKTMNLVKQVALENQADEELWHLLKSQYETPWPPANLAKLILKNSGFDPQFSYCYHCQASPPAYFLFSEAQYLCSPCRVNYNYRNQDVFAI